MSAWTDLATDQIPSTSDINSGITASSIPGGEEPVIQTAGGETIQADWTPSGSSTLAQEIHWFVNAAPYEVHPVIANATQDILNGASLTLDDDVHCQHRYVTDSNGLVGSSLATGSDVVNDNATVNASGITSGLTPTDGVSSKANILAARSSTEGALGNESNHVLVPWT